MRGKFLFNDITSANLRSSLKICKEPEQLTNFPNRYIIHRCNVQVTRRHHLIKAKCVQLAKCPISYIQLYQFQKSSSRRIFYCGWVLSFISGALAVNDPQATLPQVTHKKEGYIISHRDLPDDYTANIDSTLIISGLLPQQIVLVKFLEFQIYFLSRFPGCNNDFLQITGSGGQTFCSDPRFQPVIDEWYNFTATDSQLKFKFVTNENPTTSKGFVLQYKGRYNTQRFEKNRMPQIHEILTSISQVSLFSDD